MSVERMVYAGTSYFGEGARQKLAAELQKRNFKKVFLVSDTVLEACGVVNKITGVLEKHKIPYECFLDVKPNPTIENVHAGLAALDQSVCDVIVALGGGSVIDTAKAICVVAANPENYDVVSLEGADKSKMPPMPLIAIPTTAGTGSETTMDYVITNTAEKRKMACMNSLAVPVAAILDTEIMASLPLKMTAATAMDALTHAVESYLSKAANTFSRMLSLEAVRLISSNLSAVMDNLGDLEARKNLAMASFMAGMSFTNVGLGIVHAMAHPLSAFYDVPHGVANALILPYVMEFNSDAAEEQMGMLAGAFDDEFDLSGGCDLATKTCVDRIHYLNEKAGLPRTLSEINVVYEDIGKLAASAAADVAAADNPKAVTALDLENLYIHMF